MKESILASAHKYYFKFLTFYKGDLDVLTLVRSLQERGEHEFIPDTENTDYCHLQVYTSVLFGRESVLMSNALGDYGERYLYDFYILKLNVSNQNIIMIAYPYASMANMLHSFFGYEIMSCDSYYCNLQIVLDFFRNRGIYKDRDFDLVVFSITKYVAEILNDNKTDGIEIKGNDPVNSNLFSLVMQMPSYSIHTNYIRVRIDYGIGQFAEFNFDRFGNMTCYIKKGAQSLTMRSVRDLFSFLQDLGSLKTTHGLGLIRFRNDEADF